MYALSENKIASPTSSASPAAVATENDPTAMDLQQIMEVLPHRPPFLLVDKITHREGLQRATGIKNLTVNEYFFDGHYPGHLELPKPLLLEIMAQMGAACVLASEENKGKLILFASIDKCVFGEAPVPGDVLDLDVEMISLRRGMGKMLARCFVRGEQRASGVLMFALADPPTASQG